MKLHCLANVAAWLSLVGCASSASDSPVANAGRGGLGNVAGSADRAGSASSGAAGSSSAATGGSSGSATDTGGSSAMSDCPIWPSARLMPLVGPFFFGPNPGPCSYRSTGLSEPMRVTYSYQNGRLQSEVQTLDSSTTIRLERTYASDAEGKIVGITSADETETLEYGTGYLLETTTRTGSPAQQIRYALNARGYPVSVSITAPNQEGRMISYEYENCRLNRRTTMSSTGTVIERLNYSYDSQGRVATRLNTDGDGDTYDYSCW